MSHPTFSQVLNLAAGGNYWHLRSVVARIVLWPVLARMPPSLSERNFSGWLKSVLWPQVVAAMWNASVVPPEDGTWGGKNMREEAILELWRYVPSPVKRFKATPWDVPIPDDWPLNVDNYLYFVGTRQMMWMTYNAVYAPHWGMRVKAAEAIWKSLLDDSQAIGCLDVDYLSLGLGF